MLVLLEAGRRHKAALEPPGLAPGRLVSRILDLGVEGVGRPFCQRPAMEMRNQSPPAFDDFTAPALGLADEGIGISRLELVDLIAAERAVHIRGVEAAARGRPTLFRLLK